MCFNPQVLNSCGLRYGPIFPGHVFPSAVESENRIFPLLVLSLLLPFAAAALPMNSVDTRAAGVVVYCRLPVVCSGAFGDLQLHVQPPTC